MEQRKLIPYSVHLPADLHEALRKAARDRKASNLVRDAITMLLRGGDAFCSGYSQALTDASRVIHEHAAAKSVSINGRNVAEDLVSKISTLKPVNT